MSTKRRNVPEVPIGMGLPPGAVSFLRELRESVSDLRGPTTPPGQPTNFRVTALAFSVLLQWSVGDNADGTEVLWNSSPSLSGAVVVDAGSGQQHVDFVGNAGITRYYWVRSYDAHAPIRSQEVGPHSATTLAAATGITPPPPPVQGTTMTQDSSTNRIVKRTSRTQ